MSQTFFDPAALRSQFPALALTLNGHPAVFFDNPGGTQVPQAVIEAVSGYYRHSNANVGGAFETSRRTDQVVAESREAMADLLNAPGPETIVFGPSMTALTFHLARSLAQTITPGNEIVVTTLDHDANIAPWHDVGALVFIDAVQYAPHGPIDVQALDCDFLACSAYKFFGPHLGVLYGKAEHLQRLTPHKVKPSKDVIPNRWELGTLNHEGLAGVSAAIGYLESIGQRFGQPYRATHAAQGYSGRRLGLKMAMHAIRDYERILSEHLLSGLNGVPGIQIYGLTNPARLDERLPTIAYTWPRLSPRATAEYLASQGICVWSGNYYALKLMERLGLEGHGGAVRVGLAHYNTLAEIDRLIEVLHSVPKASV